MVPVDPPSPIPSDMGLTGAPPLSVDPRKPPRSRLWATVRAVLRARVTAGLLLVLPVWVTYLLVRFVFELMRDTSLWVVDWYLQHWGDALVKAWGVSAQEFADKGVAGLPSGIQWAVAIFSVFLTIFFLYLLGVMTANLLGRRLVHVAEGLLERVPFVKTVYRATKQILGTFAGEPSQSFQRVALVPFPTKETRSIGFITGMTKDTHTGEVLCMVFVPATPNPTSGFVFVLKRADVIELDWTVEEAIRVIISCGVLVPATIPLASASQLNAPDNPAGRSRAVSGIPAAVTGAGRTAGQA